MKFIAVFLLALVAVGNCGSIGNRPNRVVSQEILDVVYNSFVAIYHTIVDNYPQELLQEIVHELVENEGAFNFSPELQEKLDAKYSELKDKLKSELVDLAAGGEPVSVETIDQLFQYFDYAVNTLLALTPFDLIEEITKEVLANGGSFEFSENVVAQLEKAKVTYKLAGKTLLDYEFAVYDDLIDIDDEFRNKIYEALEFLVDHLFAAIPWELLEDTGFFILSNDGSVQLSDELLERIEAKIQELREKLQEALDYIEKLLGAPVIKRVLLH